MPLSKPEDFGTDRGGYRQNDYCSYCFRDGEFVTPDMSMQDMIDLSVSMMIKEGVMPEPKARATMAAVMPHLKRWAPESVMFQSRGQFAPH